MVLYILGLLLGLFLISKSADVFIDKSCLIAQKLHMPKVLIGMLILGFGTSCPELAISTAASLEGSSGIAIGNVIGSNIANIGLILGLTAIIYLVSVKSDIINRDIPFLLCICSAVATLMYFNVLNRYAGLGLLFTFVLYMVKAIRRAYVKKDDELVHEQEESVVAVEDIPLSKTSLLCFLSLVVLVLSSKLTVWGASGVASALGVSDIVIGSTIVAIGTSLPELASSITAARKKMFDLVIGNILGSNIFNTLCVLGAACLAKPLTVSPERALKDGVAMVVMTILFFLVSVNWKRRTSDGVINHYEGLFLVAGYVVYTVMLF
jgi:cation:H+ antiporter